MMRHLRVPIAFLLVLLCAAVPPAAAQSSGPPFTRADSLRGSLTAPERTWWDVTFYDLHLRISPADSTVAGHNAITYRVVAPRQEMQIDLQQPLAVDSMVQDGRAVRFRRDGDAYFATLDAAQPLGSTQTLTVYYSGRPIVAQRPPWEGGMIWARDSTGAPWVATAVQGLGASAWWPTKDVQAEEPDSQRIAITVPKPMQNVSNGRLRSTRDNADGTTTYEWFVNNPINNYNVAVNAGSYAHYSDVFQGEAGELTLDFWPLASNLEAARRQWAQAKPMLRCFEHWMGPYPWYEDGYKLVEAPHLGMEHQSAVAYGNGYQNGYQGRDLSETGRGLDWDFILVHESAHEWWGNSITSKDIADMWVHESFTNYSESLFVECQHGTQAGTEYVIGTRKLIQNDKPIIAAFGVNARGSGDMYYKGGNLLHTIRQVVGDDAKWRGILRGLNETFRHQTVTGEQVQRYVSEQAGIDLSRVFQQYLTTTQIPVLEYRIEGRTLSYRWADVVPGFDMPVGVTLPGGAGPTVLRPTQAWQKVRIGRGGGAGLQVDEDYYVSARNVGKGGAS